MAVQNFPQRRPVLLLDFQKSQRVDGRVEFTRASEATRFNRYGQLEVVQANTPRIDFDPVTGLCRGLLIEEQRTNLFERSEEFDNAYWTKTNSSITANTIVAPTGVLTGDKIVESTATGAHDVRRTGVAASASTAYTQSVYVKAAERTRGQLQMFGNSGGSTVNFNLVAGTATATGAYGGWSSASATITNVGNGWHRVTHTVTTNAGLTSFTTGVYLEDAAGSGSYTGDGTSGIFIWGAQLEAGAFPTSYIPTVASQATRNADAASITGANFNAFYRQDQGTIFGEYVGVNNVSGGTRRLVEINDGTANNRLVAGYSSTNSSRLLVVSAFTTQADVTPPVTQGSLVKFAGAYAANDFQAAANATLGTADTAGTVPAVNALFIGSDNLLTAITTLNGHIARIAYWNERLPNATLQALTS